MKTSRKCISALCLLVMAWLVAVAISRCGRGIDREMATLEARGSGLILNVEAPRPVATAVQAIVERYGYVITYEDPRYVFDGDLQDASWRVRKDFYQYFPGTAPKVIVPFGGKLAISSSSSKPLDVLGQLVSAQSASGRGGRFRVEQTGNVFHVVPTAVQDKNGRWTVQHSVLDVPISLPLKERSDVEMIKAICAAVSAAGRVEVESDTTGLGMGIVGDDGPPRYPFSADNESARSVLMRALDIIAVNRTRLTWLLYYSNETGYEGYMLNLVQVPDKSPSVKKPQTAPPVDSSENPFDVAVVPKSHSK